MESDTESSQGGPVDSYVDPRLKEGDGSEMRTFLGLQVFMDISELPRYELYWSKNPFIGNEGFKTAMIRNRYEKLLEYFHVSDPRSEQAARNSPDWEPLYKVLPAASAGQRLRQFQDALPSPQNNSIDETMIAYTAWASELQAIFAGKANQARY